MGIVDGGLLYDFFGVELVVYDRVVVIVCFEVFV